jgi:hypothetical protein
MKKGVGHMVLAAVVEALLAARNLRCHAMIFPSQRPLLSHEEKKQR